ncbi:MAG: stalk domain-containing protein [Actinomycetota bacterium]|nr:stalk domain-containing protein [Actinomycetota bacterium]
MKIFKSLKRMKTKRLIAGLMTLLMLAGLMIGLVGAPAYAANITSTASGGNWNTGSTWQGGVVPVAGDTVTIAAGATVNVTADAACASLTFTGGVASSSNVNINSGYILAVSGAVTIPRAGGSGTTNINTLAVGTGTLSAGSIAFTSGGTSARHRVTISTGTVTVTGNVTGSGNSASIIFSGSGTLNLGDAIYTDANGTLTTVAGSTVNYTGAAQTVGDFTYSNLTLSGSGTKTLPAAVTINGNLTLAGTASATTAAAETIGGNLDVGAGATFATGTTNTWDLTVSGTTSVSGTLTLANTDVKTFTGTVTVNAGGTWNETGAAAVNFASNLLNNGTFTANMRVHTFSGSGLAIGGGTAISIPRVTVTGTRVNGGTLNVGTALAGSGTLTNTGTLNLGGTCPITTLTNSGTINRTGTGTTTTALANFTNTGTVNLSGSGAITGITNNTGGTVNLTNSGTITGITNNTGGTLNITDLTPTITTLTATAINNTVNYNGAGAQTAVNTPYYNLIFSGGGAKSITRANNATLASGNFSITTGVTATITGTNLGVGTLTLGGVGRASGTWGSTASIATNQNDTYFTSTATGYVNVTTSTVPTYTLTCTAGANGSITAPASSPTTHNSGDVVTITAAANPGYHFVNWTGDVGTVADTSAASTTITMNGNYSITANFAIDTYTLTYTAGANGSITGTSPQTVNHGADGSQVTAVPDAGYHFTSWSDGVLTAARTDTNVTGNITVTASFAINTYTLTYTAGANGSITGTSPQTVNHGADGSQVTAVPAAGYHFTSWSDGVTTAARTDLNVTGDISVTASFSANAPNEIIPPVLPFTETTAIFKIAKYSYTIDDKSFDMDAAPYVKDNRTYVPVRYLAYTLGIAEKDVKWDAATKNITLTKGTTVVKLVIGSKNLDKNGAVTTMDVAPVVIPPGRTMLPARWVAEAFGATVTWNETTQTVAVTY